ncbi:MAG: phosphotransferase [Candidatus Tectomicrobia bacterium]|nr:phosphotransferase [Candidatus Tectomicrobia bacterium]
MTKRCFGTGNIPDTFVRTITELYGEAGLEWLARLPSLVTDYAQQWSLTVFSPFVPLSYNYVAPAVRSDGADVVLKVGFPNPELFTEIEALQCYDGRGVVRLLEANRADGVLLLERLKPGRPLSKEHDDRRATLIAAAVMQQLWRPAPDTQAFPSVAKWAQGLRRLRDRFEGNTGPFPARFVETAEILFTELIGSMAEPVLLHGDLHHGNILAAERQPWLALDPKGVIGEPAYEVGALLRNPRPGLLAKPRPGQVLAQRVDQFAGELGFDRARIVGWGLAQAVLSAWWSFEDHGYGWEWGIACAELLAELR